MASSVAAVIVAAGRGSRVGGDLPKQYRVLAGEPVLRTTLSTFAWHGEIAAIQTVIHGDDRAHYDAAATGLNIVMGSSWYVASTHPRADRVSEATEDELASGHCRAPHEGAYA